MGLRYKIRMRNTDSEERKEKEYTSLTQICETLIVHGSCFMEIAFRACGDIIERSKGLSSRSSFREADGKKGDSRKKIEKSRTRLVVSFRWPNVIFSSFWDYVPGHRRHIRNLGVPTSMTIPMTFSGMLSSREKTSLFWATRTSRRSERLLFKRYFISPCI